MRVAVIGGGISGLAAAWELRGRAEVTLYEPGRLGGKILTEELDGRAVDFGPDAFVTRDPAAVQLCAEVGLGNDLVAPSAGSALLWWDGRLRRLPEGLVMGAPRRLLPVARSGLLSPRGVARAGLGLVMPAPRGPAPGGRADVSVREAAARRFGAQVADRLVDPLVGSIYACPSDRLSAQATAPQLLGRPARGAAPEGPTFLTPRQGLGALVDRLAAGLDVRELEVTSLVKDGDGLRVEPCGEAFDAAVVATPAAVAAAIVGVGELKDIEAASVAVVALGYGNLPEGGLGLPEAVSGALVPASAGLLTTAISFASAKWPHWVAPGRALLRVSVGRAGEETALAMDDEGLVERVVAEISLLLGTKESPESWRVRRWRESLPCYEVGHTERVRRIRSDLRRTLPAVALCGASYRGIGIPACISSGRAAAAEVLA